jgi:hypothetical protein
VRSGQKHPKRTEISNEYQCVNYCEEKQSYIQEGSSVKTKKVEKVLCYHIWNFRLFTLKAFIGLNKIYPHYGGSAALLTVK